MPNVTFRSPDGSSQIVSISSDYIQPAAGSAGSITMRGVWNTSRNRVEDITVRAAQGSGDQFSYNGQLLHKIYTMGDGASLLSTTAEFEPNTRLITITATYNRPVTAVDESFKIGDTYISGLTESTGNTLKLYLQPTDEVYGLLSFSFKVRDSATVVSTDAVTESQLSTPLFIDSRDISISEVSTFDEDRTLTVVINSSKASAEYLWGEDFFDVPPFIPVITTTPTSRMYVWKNIHNSFSGRLRLKSTLTSDVAPEFPGNPSGAVTATNTITPKASTLIASKTLSNRTLTILFTSSVDVAANAWVAVRTGDTGITPVVTTTTRTRQYVYTLPDRNDIFNFSIAMTVGSAKDTITHTVEPSVNNISTGGSRIVDPEGSPTYIFDFKSNTRSIANRFVRITLGDPYITPKKIDGYNSVRWVYFQPRNQAPGTFPTIELTSNGRTVILRKQPFVTGLVVEGEVFTTPYKRVSFNFSRVRTFSSNRGGQGAWREVGAVVGLVGSLGDTTSRTLRINRDSFSNLGFVTNVSIFYVDPGADQAVASNTVTLNANLPIGVRPVIIEATKSFDSNRNLVFSFKADKDVASNQWNAVFTGDTGLVRTVTTTARTRVYTYATIPGIHTDKITVAMSVTEVGDNVELDISFTPPFVEQPAIVTATKNYDVDGRDLVVTLNSNEPITTWSISGTGTTIVPTETPISSSSRSFTFTDFPQAFAGTVGIIGTVTDSAGGRTTITGLPNTTQVVAIGDIVSPNITVAKSYDVNGRDLVITLTANEPIASWNITGTGTTLVPTTIDISSSSRSYTFTNFPNLFSGTVGIVGTVVDEAGNPTTITGLTNTTQVVVRAVSRLPVLTSAFSNVGTEYRLLVTADEDINNRTWLETFTGVDDFPAFTRINQGRTRTYIWQIPANISTVITTDISVEDVDGDRSLPLVTSLTVTGDAISPVFTMGQPALTSTAANGNRNYQASYTTNEDVKGVTFSITQDPINGTPLVFSQEHTARGGRIDITIPSSRTVTFKVNVMGTDLAGNPGSGQSNQFTVRDIVPPVATTLNAVFDTNTRRATITANFNEDIASSVMATLTAGGTAIPFTNSIVDPIFPMISSRTVIYQTGVIEDTTFGLLAFSFKATDTQGNESAAVTPTSTDTNGVVLLTPLTIPSGVAVPTEVTFPAAKWLGSTRNGEECFGVKSATGLDARFATDGRTNNAGEITGLEARVYESEAAERAEAGVAANDYGIAICSAPGRTDIYFQTSTAADYDTLPATLNIELGGVTQIYSRGNGLGGRRYRGAAIASLNAAQSADVTMTILDDLWSVREEVAFNATPTISVDVTNDTLANSSNQVVMVFTASEPVTWTEVSRLDESLVPQIATTTTTRTYTYVTTNQTEQDIVITMTASDGVNTSLQAVGSISLTDAHQPNISTSSNVYNATTREWRIVFGANENVTWTQTYTNLTSNGVTLVPVVATTSRQVSYTFNNIPDAYANTIGINVTATDTATARNTRTNATVSQTVAAKVVAQYTLPAAEWVLDTNSQAPCYGFRSAGYVGTAFANFASGVAGVKILESGVDQNSVAQVRSFEFAICLSATTSTLIVNTPPTVDAGNVFTTEITTPLVVTIGGRVFTFTPRFVFGTQQILHALTDFATASDLVALQTADVEISVDTANIVISGPANVAPTLTSVTTEFVAATRVLKIISLFNEDVTGDLLPSLTVGGTAVTGIVRSGTGPNVIYTATLPNLTAGAVAFSFQGEDAGGLKSTAVTATNLVTQRTIPRVGRLTTRTITIPRNVWSTDGGNNGFKSTDLPFMGDSSFDDRSPLDILIRNGLTGEDYAICFNFFSSGFNIISIVSPTAVIPSLNISIDGVSRTDSPSAIPIEPKSGGTPPVPAGYMTPIRQRYQFQNANGPFGRANNNPPAVDIVILLNTANLFFSIP